MAAGERWRDAGEGAMITFAAGVWLCLAALITKILAAIKERK